MGMFGARTRAPESTDLAWLFPSGVPRVENGPNPLGYNPPFVPPDTLAATSQINGLGQRCLNALQVTHKSPADVARVAALMPILRTAAGPYSIDARMLAAIALRESAGKNIAEVGNGNGMGVFQLTNQPIRAAQAYDVPFAADFAAKMLAGNQKVLAKRHPNFTSEQLLQATLASYNKYFGHGRSLITDDPNTIDAGTPGRNYGRNVLDLMSCFP